MALWSGRFEEETNDFAMHFGASLVDDMSMAEEDVIASMAHASMLAQQGIISEADAEAIFNGLTTILQELSDGNLLFDETIDEDIHMAVERVLTERIGSAGARLHTGRSRNDQVATDLRISAKRMGVALAKALALLQSTLLSAAEKNLDVIMPGYTHLQHAQPVRFSHHLLAYFWMLDRDQTRVIAAIDAADANPLGAAALAGTSYPIDRESTSDLLDFAETIPNSLDAVSDRDFLIDLVYACSTIAVHLSRFAEEIILWSSQEFGFITLSDEWSTGSSIMPQKKNPDFAELVRGKSGRIIGDLTGLLATMKGLPLAYNKDLQVSKENIFLTVATTIDCLTAIEGMVSSWTVHEKTMLEAAKTGFTAATDIADYLAKKGMPFREAHAVVGKLVLDCEKRGIGLEDLSFEDFANASELFEKDILGSLDPRSIADARTSFGGTGRKAVLEQIEYAKEMFETSACFLKTDEEQDEE